jgi:hypothetical protein
MAHEIGLVENQHNSDIGLFSTVVTNTATPFEIRRINAVNGEGGRLKIELNSITGEASPRQANRERTHRFTKSGAGELTIRNPQTNETQADTGMNAVDYTVEVIDGGLSIKVVGLAGVEVRHTILVRKLSGALHESFT